MDRVRELLQSLTQLSSEDLEELRGLILSEFDRVDGEDTTAENVAMLQELADAGEQVQAESSAREQAQAQAEADKQAARERIAAITPNAEQPDEEADAENAENAEEVEEPAAEVEAPEPVAASAVARIAARAPKPVASPEAAAPRAALVAAGGMRDVEPGTIIEDRYQLAQGFAGALNRMPRSGPARGEVILATADWSEQYPDERKLRPSDPEYNTRVFDSVSGPQALTASGGICAPVNVDWSYGMLAVADRPVRDGLPSFNATRGGLTFRPDLDIAGLMAATSLWTQATDANPGNATKPLVSVACPAPVTVYVDAIPTRVGFGNMQARFDPETVAANTDAAIAAAARFAENTLLNKIAAQCTQNVTSAQIVGATRDLLTVIDEVVAGYRNLHRLNEQTMLTVILPAWVKPMLRADLAKEIGHAQTADWNSLAIPDAKFTELLAAHGVKAIWHLDGQPNSVSGGVAQVFAAQASGAVNAFPSKVVSYVFAEGQFQFLDGGRLDLGVVRDATLDATNDYETFVETFEGLAFRGFPGGAIQLVSSLCANGGSTGTVAVGACA